MFIYNFKKEKIKKYINQKIFWFIYAGFYSCRYKNKFNRALRKTYSYIVIV